MALGSIIASRLFTLFVAGGISAIVKNSAGENTLLSEIGSASFGEGVGGSIADLFKEGSATAFEKVLNQIAQPHQDQLNHHLNRAARKAQLLATFFACRGCLSEIEGDNRKDVEKKWLEKLGQSLAKRINNIENENLSLSVNREDISVIFNTEDKTIGEAEQTVIKKLQEETFDLILTDAESFPIFDRNGFTLLKNCIETGWTEQETPTAPIKKYDWFSLLCGAFNDEYKEPENFAAMQKVQNREIFDRIAESLGTNGASFDELYKSLKDTNKIVSRTEGKTDFLTDFVMRFSKETHFKLDNIEKVSQETKENTERIAVEMTKDFDQRFREKLAQAEVGTVLGNFIFVRPTRFFNREEELKILRSFILENAQPITVIKGAGGYGKTSLADYFLKEIAPHGKISAAQIVNEIVIFNGQFDEITFEKIFDRASELLERAFKAESEKSVLREVFKTQMPDGQRIGLLFEQLARVGKVWFIFDNFESVLTGDNNLRDERLRTFLELILKNGANLRLILTTREVPVFEGSNGVSLLEMKGQLPRADAVAYLKQLAESGNINWRISGADDAEKLLAAVSEKLRYIPKALFSFADYFKQDRERPLVLKKVLENEDLFADFAKYDLEKGYSKLVGEQFECLNALEKSVWFALAIFNEPVSPEALKFVLSEYDLTDIWKLLHGSGLIVVEEREIGGEFYFLFSLDQSAQDYVYNLLPADGETLSRRELHRRAAEFYNSIRQPIKDCYTRKQFAPYFNAIDQFYAAGLYEDAATLLYEDIVKLCALGHLKEIINRCRLLEGKLSEEKLEIGNFINLGIALDSFGRFNNAMDEYDKAIAIYEELVDDRKRDELANSLAKVHTNKGITLDRLDRSNEAVDEYKKAIAIGAELVNDRKIDELADTLAKAYMNKGVALSRLGRWSEAIYDYDEAITSYENLVNERKRGELANDLASAYLNKGVAFRNLVQLNEAVIEYNKAIAIRENLVNQQKREDLASDLAMTYWGIGNVLINLGKLNEAERKYNEAIEIWYGCLKREIKQILPNLFTVFYLKTVVLINLEQWKQVAESIIETYRMREKVLNEYEISQHFKNQIESRWNQIIQLVRNLSSANREEIYKYAGENGEVIRRLVEDEGDE